MFLKLILLSLFISSISAYSQENSFEYVNRYLKSRQPYADYIKKTETFEVCETKVSTREEICYEKERRVPDAQRREELNGLLNAHEAKLAVACNDKTKINNNLDFKELCYNMLGLKKFLYLSEKLEGCKSDKNLNSGLDRAINASGLEVERSFDVCLRDIDLSQPLDENQHNLIGDLAEEFEKKQFKDLGDFLIEDALNESVRASLVFGAAIGDSDIDIDKGCISQEAYVPTIAGTVSKLEERDLCHKSNRDYVEKLKQKKLKSSKYEIQNQNIEKSKNIINAKIKLLNIAMETRNKDFSEYKKKRTEYREKLERVLGSPSKYSSDETVLYIANMMSIFEKDFLTPINDIYNRERSRIINTEAVAGTDELYQTDVLQKRLQLGPAGAKELEPIKDLSKSDVKQGFEEAKTRSDIQIAKLIKMKQKLARAENYKKRDLSYKERKKELMRLVSSNPVSVGKALVRYPEYSNNLCQINASLMKQKKNKEFWDKTFLVVGVGSAVAVGVAALPFTGGASSSLIFFAGASTGIALSGTEIATSYYYENIALERLNDSKSAALNRLGDEQTGKDIINFTRDYKSAKFQKNLAIALAPLDFIGIGGASRLGRGRKIASVESEPSIKKITPPEKIRPLSPASIKNREFAESLEGSDRHLYSKWNKALLEEFPDGLSKEQFEGIQKAFKVGEGEPGVLEDTIAQINNFTTKQVEDKVLILRAAGFSPKQIQIIGDSAVGYSPDYLKLNRSFRKTIDTTHDATNSLSSEVIKRTKEARDRLNELNVNFKQVRGTGVDARTHLLNRATLGHDGGASVVKADGKVADPFGDYSFNVDKERVPRNFSRNYGAIFRVKGLPKAKIGSKHTDNALEHPLMAKFFKDLEAIGVKLNIDPTVGYKTSIKANYDKNTKSIYITPDTDWTTFAHEFQHAQNDFLMKQTDIFTQEVVEGFLDNGVKKSVTIVKINPKYKDNFEEAIKDVLPDFPDKDIALMRKNIEDGHPLLAINERASHNRQLDLIPDEDKLSLKLSDNRELHALQYEADQLEVLRQVAPERFKEEVHGKALENIYKRFQRVESSDISSSIPHGGYASSRVPWTVTGFKPASPSDIKSLREEFPELSKSIDKDTNVIKNQELDLEISQDQVIEVLMDSKLSLNAKAGVRKASSLLHSTENAGEYMLQLQADVAKMMKQEGLLDDLRAGKLDPAMFRRVLANRAAEKNLDLVTINGTGAVHDQIDKGLKAQYKDPLKNPDEYDKSYDLVARDLFFEQAVKRGVLHRDNAITPDDAHSLIAHYIQQDYTYSALKEGLGVKTYKEVGAFLNTHEGRKIWDAIYDSLETVPVKDEPSRVVRTLTSPEYWKELLEKTDNVNFKQLEENH